MGLERQKGVWHSWGTETVESQIVLHKLSMNIKLDCVGAIGEGSGVEREKWEEREKKGTISKRQAVQRYMGGGLPDRTFTNSYV